MGDQENQISSRYYQTHKITKLFVLIPAFSIQLLHEQDFSLLFEHLTSQKL
jgi:hypothetical protein